MRKARIPNVIKNLTRHLKLDKKARFDYSSTVGFQRVFVFFLAIWTIIPHASVFASMALANVRTGDTRYFWIWDQNLRPAASRKISAKAHAVGLKSFVFIDDSLPSSHNSQLYATELLGRLETTPSLGAYLPGAAIIPTIERIFAPLPWVINPDARAVVLIANLGPAESGYFSEADQVSDREAQARFQRRSNEINIVYVNADALSMEETPSLLSRELSQLATHHSRVSFPPQEKWLNETSAAASSLLAGYSGVQTTIDQYVQGSELRPLVDNVDFDLGASTLFASFLLDHIGGYGGFDRIARMPEAGRHAVEKAIEINFGVPTSFDSVFGDFISYSYIASLTGEELPSSWSFAGSKKIRVPGFAPVATTASFPFQFSGKIRAYAFAVIELKTDLPANVDIQVTRLDIPLASDPCRNTLNLLWKPLPGAIAVYAVGCESKNLIDYQVEIRALSEQ